MKEEFIALANCNEDDADAKNVVNAAIYAASNAVNCFGYDPETIAKELISDERSTEVAIDMAVQWVELCFVNSKFPGMYDDRNEIAVKRSGALHDIAWDLLDAIVTRNHEGCPVWQMATRFAKEAQVRMHRTLMQSFTSVVFCILKNDPDYGTELDARMTNEFDSKWYRMPLI